MPNPVITNNDTSALVVADDVYNDGILSVAGAATVAKNTILGRLTANGQLRAYVSGAADGSEIPVAVLASDEVFTGAGTRAVRALVSGQVRRDKLVIAAGGSVSVALADQLRDMGIISHTSTNLTSLDNA